MGLLWKSFLKGKLNKEGLARFGPRPLRKMIHTAHIKTNRFFKNQAWVVGKWHHALLQGLNREASQEVRGLNWMDSFCWSSSYPWHLLKSDRQTLLRGLLCGVGVGLTSVGVCGRGKRLGSDFTYNKWEFTAKACRERVGPWVENY